MSIFSKIATAVAGSANNRVEVAMNRYSAARERIAAVSERIASDTERVAEATERVADLNAARLGFTQANDFLVRIEYVDGSPVVKSEADLAALLAPVVPAAALAAPTGQTEETENESEKFGHPTTSRKPKTKKRGKK